MMNASADKFSQKCIERERCEELAKSSSFYRKVYSEIEEIGWEPLKRLGGDLTFFSFHILDKKGRAHILEIQLNRDYPNSPPSLSADVPYMFNLEWLTSSRLKDVMHQFQKVISYVSLFVITNQQIQNRFFFCVNSIWTIFKNFGLSWTISISLSVLLMLSNHLVLLLSVGFMLGTIASSLFISTSTTLKAYQSAGLLVLCLQLCICYGEEIAKNGTELPKPPGLHKEDDQQQVECGICYAQFLPTDEELGARSGTRTDYTCENISCNKSFHSLCLTDWLRSITTTRQSFDVLFGNCPYCSDPVAVKINNK